MAPFNMRCKSCGEYIYKGKKFNVWKETVQNELHLGLPIFRNHNSIMLKIMIRLDVDFNHKCRKTEYA
ncbi:coiled-coil domain-containing protein 94 [Silurus meridionalis]|nr:coiled-coil domain-containing protein 94 [Silurus meridionalis]